MGVAHALILKIALIVAADDKTVPIGQLHRLNIRRVIAPRILNTRRPRLSAGLGADGPQIAADIQQGTCEAAHLRGPGGLLHGVALADRPDIQRHIRVGKADSLRSIIQNQVIDVDVLQCLRDGIRSGRGRGVTLPRIVPQAQHRTRCDVCRAIGRRVGGVLAPAQKCV